MAREFQPMDANPSLPTDSMESLHRGWQDCLDRMLDCLIQQLPPGRLADNAREQLQTLPLPTAEFGLARVRLGNIEAYARDGEWGAAAFELRRLRRLGDPAPDKH